MPASWGDLFERAQTYDIDLEEVRAVDSDTSATAAESAPAPDPEGEDG